MLWRRGGDPDGASQASPHNPGAGAPGLGGPVLWRRGDGAAGAGGILWTRGQDVAAPAEAEVSGSSEGLGVYPGAGDDVAPAPGGVLWTRGEGAQPADEPNPSSGPNGSNGAYPAYSGTAGDAGGSGAAGAAVDAADYKYEDPWFAPLGGGAAGAASSSDGGAEKAAGARNGSSEAATGPGRSTGGLPYPTPAARTAPANGRAAGAAPGNGRSRGNDGDVGRAGPEAERQGAGAAVGPPGAGDRGAPAHPRNRAALLDNFEFRAAQRE